MVSEQSDIRRDFKFGLVVFIIVSILFVISILALTAGRGLESEEFTKIFQLYMILGIVGLGYHLFILLYNYFTRSRALRIIIHEPEESVLRDVKIVRNPLLLLLFMLIIFTPLMLVFGRANSFFFVIPHELQQITGSASVWGDSIFPALAENLVSFIVLSWLYTLSWKLYHSKRPVFHTINYVVIPVLFGVFWYLFHLARYGSNEVALSSVFFFSLVGMVITMLTMSAIPFFVLHFMNNFMLSLRLHGFLGNDYVTQYVIVAEVVLIALFVLVYIRNKHPDKVLS